MRGVRKSPTPRDHETSGEYFQSGERTPARRRMPGCRAVSEPHKCYASAGPGAPAPASRFVIEGRRCPRPEGSSQAPHNLPHVFQRRGPGQPGACSSAGGAPARAHCGEKGPAHRPRHLRVRQGRRRSGPAIGGPSAVTKRRYPQAGLAIPPDGGARRGCPTPKRSVNRGARAWGHQAGGGAHHGSAKK